jgi:hypothetical protein
MHKLSLLASGLLFAAIAAGAPIACPVGTAATYISSVDSAGGCTEDGLLFSNFNYIPSSSGTAVALPASALAIAPLLNTAGDGFGFQIAGGFAASSGGVADGVIQYEVSTVNSSATLDGLNLTFDGTSTGSGIASTSENYCPGGTSVPPTTCSAGLGNIFVQSSQGVSKLSASATYTPATSITVSKDIQVNGSTVVGSSATISSVTNQFQQITSATVPEPANLLLFPGGLLVLFLVRKKTRLS